MKNIFVLSGAGLSKESGIPTFRDSKDGLWHNHKIEDVASPEGWQKDKNLVLQFYQQRTENVLACEPNAAHKAFAKLDEKYNRCLIKFMGQHFTQDSLLNHVKKTIQDF